MRVRSLGIQNFKGIESFEISDLGDMVVIAGPNGCGKSCALDAVRLIKSAYGGHQPNEWHQWFGEFNLNVNRNPEEVVRLLRDRNKNLVVEATFEMAETERDFLRDNAELVVWPQVWRQLVPQGSSVQRQGQAVASELRLHGPRVDSETRERVDALMPFLVDRDFSLRFEVDSLGRMYTEPNLVAETLFQHYEPEQIGIIDFYSAQRQYAREQIGGMNLNLEQFEDQRRNHLLYGSQNKLQNVKAELAASYIADLIAADAGAPRTENSLQETLKELFAVFFEGKSFQGVSPTPSGKPSFPVLLSDGSSHDIDDLSSGEKEILYGYLRLRNSRSRNSILLIDEPELHLNPRLVQGLPAFYHRHIGREFNNQIWLVTHSDALLRESVGSPGFSVFHMQSDVGTTNNQARVLDTESELDRAIVSIVGDLAAYRPGSPILVLEGAGDPAFDVSMVSRLFPEVAARANLVAGGSKAGVRDVYRLLSEVSSAGGVLAGSIHAIVDLDSDAAPTSDDSHQVGTWDVYHIENYLLWDEGILAALRAALGESPYAGVDEVREALRRAAEETMPELVSHRLRADADRALFTCLDLGFDPGAEDAASALAQAVERASLKFQDAITKLTATSLGPKAESVRGELEAALADDTWRQTFRGRDVLRRFAGNVPGHNVRYEMLRNLILDRMAIEDYRPAGMEAMLRSVLPSTVWET